MPTFDTHLDLPYRPGGSRHLLDVILPKGSGPWPVVVCIHGGGWRKGSKENVADRGYRIAEAGFAVVMPNYRLTVTHSHPAQEEDIYAVLAWVADHANEYRLDPHRLALTGSSAGGHLAALVGIKGTRRPNPCYTIRCILPMWGVHDIELWVRERPPYLETHVEPLWGGDPQQWHDVERDCSPIAHIHPDAPPCLAFHGDQDQAVPPDQSMRLVDALQQAGVPSRCVLIPGAGHSATMLNGTHIEASDVFLAFLRQYLGIGEVTYE